MKLFKMIGCLMAVVVALFLWCNNSEAKDIVIGYTGPLSGPAAEYGQECANGLDMAVKQVNATGGIKIKGEKYDFKLVKYDDGMDPVKTVNNARRMQEQDHAIAIFSGITPSIYAMMKINREKGHEFLVMGYTSSPTLPKMGNELTIGVPPTFSVYAEVEAKWAWNKGYRKAGIIVTNEVYGVEWTDFFSRYFKKLGGTITAVKPINMYTETDFSAAVTAVLATKPDVILAGGPSATTALVVEQARNLGYKGGFVFIDQAKVEQMAAMLKGYSLLHDSISVASVGNLPAPITPWFEKTFKANYKGQYSWEVVLHYAEAVVISRAVQAAGTATDVRAIRKAFPKAYPILGDKAPTEMWGLTADGRQEMFCATQSVDKDGKLSKPQLQAFWPKTQKEWNTILKTTKFDPKLADFVWMRVEDYKD